MIGQIIKRPGLAIRQLLVVLALVLFISEASAQEAAVIKNKAKGRWNNTHKMVLKKIITIGEAETEDYFFAQIANVHVDRSGNIFVLDRGENDVKVFNQDGEYVRTFGRRVKGRVSCRLRCR